MSNKASLAIQSIVSFLISVCLIWCIASSFDVNVSPVIIFIAVMMFTSVFSVVSIFLKERNKFLMSVAVIGIIFIFTMLFSLKTILSQANYFSNCFLNSYSQAFTVPSTVKFSENIANDANFLFAFAGAILSAINTISLVRIKRIIPVTIEVLLLLVPCFVLINTMPSVVPLITVTALLISLYVTSFLRKYNFKSNGAILLAVNSIVIAVSVIFCNIFPLENYKRFEWQINLQNYAENLLGFNDQPPVSNDEETVENITSETRDLTQAGPLEQKSKKMLKVYSEHSGGIYLKGLAFANYNDNEWSALTTKQAESYPDNFNTFTMTYSDAEFEEIRILTENKEDIVYTPYFSLAFSEIFEPKYDVFVRNKYEQLAYDFTYIPFSEGNEYYLNSNILYNEFVSDIYLELPEDTKAKMLKIAEENGLAETAYDDIPKAVEEFVSNHAYYSLDTEKMPDDKDFPVWFLNEAESGYCVHYATSATVMLRALGVPARYVTGYYANVTENEWTTVTTDNAHAWTEYYHFDYGWIPLDATPSSFSPPVYVPEEKPTTTSLASQSTTPEETTAEMTEAIAQPTEVSSAQDSPDSINKSSDLKALWIILAVLGLIMAVALVIVVRYAVITSIQKKSFTTGRNNQRAIYMYRYIEKINEFSHIITPDEILDIAQRARFSNHTITREEIKILADFSDKLKSELYHNSSTLRKIYFKYIVVI